MQARKNSNVLGSRKSFIQIYSIKGLKCILFQNAAVNTAKITILKQVVIVGGKLVNIDNKMLISPL